MWIIPIIYKLKFDKLNHNKHDILDAAVKCLEEYNFKFINRNEDSIYFHDVSFYTIGKKRESIGSGTIKVKELNGKLILSLTHSGIFLILLIFAILYILFFSKFSTFDYDDREIFFIFFGGIFGIAYITRLFSHYNLIRKIKKQIENKQHLTQK